MAGYKFSKLLAKMVYNTKNNLHNRESNITLIDMYTLPLLTYCM